MKYNRRQCRSSQSLLAVIVNANAVAHGQRLHLSVSRRQPGGAALWALPNSGGLRGFYTAVTLSVARATFVVCLWVHHVKTQSDEVLQGLPAAVQDMRCTHHQCQKLSHAFRVMHGIRDVSLCMCVIQVLHGGSVTEH